MLLEILNGQRPWLYPFLPILKNLVGTDLKIDVVRDDWREYLDLLATRSDLKNYQNKPIRFVPQSSLPPNISYETFIGATGGVPTRENLHDFFNALIWLTYPISKAAINLIHLHEIDRKLTLQVSQPQMETPQFSTRGVLRDRATIFDENAALMLTCDPSLASSLAAHEWEEVLLKRRADFGILWDLALFGHALIEKLVNPYKAITAHVWVLYVEPTFFKLGNDAKCVAIDALLCEQLHHKMLMRSPAHLPILGVPGWWHGQDKNFYSDVNVFRLKRV